MNKLFTKAECTDSLQKKLVQYDAEIKGPRCIRVAMAPNVEAAFVSTAYNLGPGVVCKYFAPLINSGNVTAACNKLPQFVYAGGQRVQGLVNRRAAERKLCLQP
jgi:lysozyme